MHSQVREDDRLSGASSLKFVEKLSMAWVRDGRGLRQHLNYSQESDRYVIVIFSR